MFFLIYVSAAVTWFSSTELHALLASSRQHNQRAGITGLLLYKDGNFMQVLEGDEAAVRALHQRIAADLRHHGMVTIDSGTVAERQFGQWCMGFSRLDDGSQALPAGYSDFMHTALIDPALTGAPHHCWQMLRLFSQMD